MDGQIADLFKLPNIGEYEDLHLLTLSENCAALEEQVYAIAKALPDRKRQVLEAYISTRNDLEVETFKTALRWGKYYYKQQLYRQKAARISPNVTKLGKTVILKL